MHRMTSVGVMIGAAIGAVAPFWPATAYGDEPPAPSAAAAPLTFEPNRGQFDPRVRFASRGNGYTLFLTDTGAVIALRGTEPSEGHGPSAPGAVIRLALENAAPRHAVGLDRQPGIVNYIVGRDPAAWRTGIETYGRVEYRNVAPGVDLVYYGRDGVHEYDLVVAPGSEPANLAMRVTGAESLTLDAAGHLRVTTAAGGLTMRAPHVYQVLDGTPRTVAARYTLGEAGRIGFDIGDHDPTVPLIIDPELVYGTFLGGSGDGIDQALGVAVDASGAAYVVGSTDAADFPTAGPLDAQLGGQTDAFVTRLSPDGTQRVYSTYLGGTGFDSATAVTVNADGTAYVLGETTSSDFPTAAAFQAQAAGGGDAFVVELSAAGDAIVHGTYLGGSGGETARGLELSGLGGSAADIFGDALIVYGSTTSTNFPTLRAAQSGRAGERDGFVTVLDRQTLQPRFSSYAGAAGSNQAEGLTLNRRSGAMYLLLRRSDDVLPLVARFMPAAADVRTAAALAAPSAAPSGWSMAMLVLDIGLSDEAQRRAQAKSVGILACSRRRQPEQLPALGLLYAQLCSNDPSAQDRPAGPSAAPNLSQAVMAAVMPGCYPSSGACSERAELLAFDADMHAIAHVNFGGTRAGREFIPTRGVIGVDGRVHFIGTTNDTTLPVVNPVQARHAGSGEGFVVTIDPLQGATTFFSYLGGSSYDTLADLAVDEDGTRWIAGTTQSADFPVTPGAAQQTLNGRVDGFVVKIGADPSGPAAPSGLTALTSGLAVALAWQPSAGATSYQVEAGTAPGLSNLANIDVGNRTALQTTAPAGRYYVRIRAHTAAGTSTPSNEVTFVLAPPGACVAPPAAPAGPSAQVDNLRVVLSWQPAVGAASYVVEAGTAPGLANLLNVDVGATTAIAASAPAGTYFTRIRARNACGISAPSSELPVTLGCTAAPGAAGGLAFSRAGSALALGWGAAPRATGYRLQVGTAAGITNLLDLAVGNVLGLQVDVRGVPAGRYFVRIVGANACGVGTASNEVVISIP